MQTIIGGVVLLCILWLGKTTKDSSSMPYFENTVMPVAKEKKPKKFGGHVYSLSNQLVRATLFMPFPVSLGQPVYGKPRSKKNSLNPL